MAIVIVQREAIGRPGLPVPSRYERIWLCHRCDWWGTSGGPHYAPDGSLGIKCRPADTYETYFDVKATVYPRFRDAPVYSRSRNR